MLRRQSGFTFLELAICIVILGIIAAVAVPRFYDMQEDAEAQTARSVVANVKTALTQGFSRGISYADLTTTGAGANEYFDNIIAMIQTDFSTDRVTIVDTADREATITFVKSGRSVQLEVDATSEVILKNPVGFNVHSIVNGDLVK